MRYIANIEYSNYRLSISFPTGLPTISACRCSATPNFRVCTPSLTVVFPCPPSCFSRARTFSRAFHTFPRPRKKSLHSHPCYFLSYYYLTALGANTYASVHACDTHRISKFIAGNIGSLWVWSILHEFNTSILDRADDQKIWSNGRKQCSLYFDVCLPIRMRLYYLICSFQATLLMHMQRRNPKAIGTVRYQMLSNLPILPDVRPTLIIAYPCLKI